MAEERALLSIRRGRPGAAEAGQVVTNQEFNLQARLSRRPETGGRSIPDEKNAAPTRQLWGSSGRKQFIL